MIAALGSEKDAELLNSIQDKVRWDKRVSLADLQISVLNGVVILGGVVDTSYKKQAALEIVGGTEGVWSIEDRIGVPADYYRSDEEIQEIIQTEMSEILKLGGEHIEVDVIDGLVKLDGEVFRPRLKALAVSMAWELSGVKDCVNLIEITEPPHHVPLHNPAFDIDCIISLTRT